MFPLDEHTIFVTLAGSQAHGTARVGSDVDLRGVCVAPMSTRLSLFNTFEQFEGLLDEGLLQLFETELQARSGLEEGLETKAECVVFDIAKFVRLCANANPNALEILFADPQDWLFETPKWRQLHDERHHFLTKKVRQTFLGYAMAQLKKLKNHRARLFNPPKSKPTREDFGLPASVPLGRDDQNRIEEALVGKMRTYGADDLDMPAASRIALNERMEAFHRDLLETQADDLSDYLRAVASHALGLPPEVVQTLNAEKKYRGAMKSWESHQTWERERNSARSELERLHGYDTKHAGHLIRLMRMGLEVLKEGELHVRREDAEELLAIRDGSLSFEELLSAAATLEEEMAKAVLVSELPGHIDREFVDDLACRLMIA